MSDKKKRKIVLGFLESSENVVDNRNIYTYTHEEKKGINNR